MCVRARARLRITNVCVHVGVCMRALDTVLSGL